VRRICWEVHELEIITFWKVSDTCSHIFQFSAERTQTMSGCRLNPLELIHGMLFFSIH
jgi:hypothetical protein